MARHLDSPPKKGKDTPREDIPAFLRNDPLKPDEQNKNITVAESLGSMPPPKKEKKVRAVKISKAPGTSMNSRTLAQPRTVYSNAQEREEYDDENGDPVAIARPALPRQRAGSVNVIGSQPQNNSEFSTSQALSQIESNKKGLAGDIDAVPLGRKRPKASEQSNEPLTQVETRIETETDHMVNAVNAGLEDAGEAESDFEKLKDIWGGSVPNAAMNRFEAYRNTQKDIPNAIDGYLATEKDRLVALKNHANGLSNGALEKVRGVLNDTYGAGDYPPGVWEKARDLTDNLYKESISADGETTFGVSQALDEIEAFKNEIQRTDPLITTLGGEAVLPPVAVDPEPQVIRRRRVKIPEDVVDENASENKEEDLAVAPESRAEKKGFLKNLIEKGKGVLYGKIEKASEKFNKGANYLVGRSVELSRKLDSSLEARKEKKIEKMTNTEKAEYALKQVEKQNSALNKKLEKLGVGTEKFISNAGDLYNKLPLKYKVAFGLGMVTGTILTGGAWAGVLGGLAGVQRVVGFAGSYARAKERVNTFEGQQSTPLTDKEKRRAALALATIQAAVMSGVVGGAIAVGRESGLGEWLRDQVGTSEKPAEPAGNTPSQSPVQSTPAPAPAEAPAQPTPLEGSGFKVVVPEGGGTLASAIELHRQELGTLPEPEQYREGSDARRIFGAKDAQRSGMIAEVAKDNGIIGRLPEGTKISFDKTGDLVITRPEVAASAPAPQESTIQTQKRVAELQRQVDDDLAEREKTQRELTALREKAEKLEKERPEAVKKLEEMKRVVATESARPVATAGAPQAESAPRTPARVAPAESARITESVSRPPSAELRGRLDRVFAEREAAAPRITDPDADSVSPNESPQQTPPQAEQPLERGELPQQPRPAEVDVTRPEAESGTQPAPAQEPVTPAEPAPAEQPSRPSPFTPEESRVLEGALNQPRQAGSFTAPPQFTGVIEGSPNAGSPASVAPEASPQADSVVNTRGLEVSNRVAHVYTGYNDNSVNVFGGTQLERTTKIEEYLHANPRAIVFSGELSNDRTRRVRIPWTWVDGKAQPGLPISRSPWDLLGRALRGPWADPPSPQDFGRLIK